MAFQQLDQHINKALLICGYKTPTPIQAKAIPLILGGNDLVASSETGSGKTGAFVLPTLHLLGMQKPSKKPRVLILTPTRELADQITKAALDFGKFSRFNITSLVGGMPYGPQIRDLSRGADIIVATPGRLMDHIENKRVDLSNIEILILDEADRMLDMGFIEDIEYIVKLIPTERQTLLFSATVDKKLSSVVKHFLKNPVRIDLSHEKMAPAQIKQSLYKVSSPQHKSRLLKHFLNDANIFKAIIFSATKMNADKLANQLRDDGFAAAPLHGDLRQNVRTRTLDQLRRGKIQYLIATDVAARGIDVDDVTHVFNYDLPRFCEDYVHRIGRTGRAGKAGIAISFVLPADARHLKSIERYLGQKLPVMHSIELGEAPSSNQREVNEFKKSADEQPSVSYRASKRRSFGKENNANKHSGATLARSDKKPKTSWKKTSYSNKERWTPNDDRPARAQHPYPKKYGHDANNTEKSKTKERHPFKNEGGAKKRVASGDGAWKKKANKNRNVSDHTQKTRVSGERTKRHSNKSPWTGDNNANKKSIASGYGPLKKSPSKRKHRFASE